MLNGSKCLLTESVKKVAIVLPQNLFIEILDTRYRMLDTGKFARII